jgi:hypothetical protein
MYTEKPLHGERVTVWAALSLTIDRVIFFEDDGNVATINKDRYFTILKKKFILTLRRESFNINKIWFQQDGATPHTAGDVIKWLYDTFVLNFISRTMSGHCIPPTSTHLTFFFGDI